MRLPLSGGWNPRAAKHIAPARLQLTSRAANTHVSYTTMQQVRYTQWRQTQQPRRGRTSTHAQGSTLNTALHDRRSNQAFQSRPSHAAATWPWCAQDGSQAVIAAARFDPSCCPNQRNLLIQLQQAAAPCALTACPCLQLVALLAAPLPPAAWIGETCQQRGAGREVKPAQGRNSAGGQVVTADSRTREQASAHVDGAGRRAYSGCVLWHGQHTPVPLDTPRRLCNV